MKFIAVTVYQVCQLIIELASLVIRVFRKKNDETRD